MNSFWSYDTDMGKITVCCSDRAVTAIRFGEYNDSVFVKQETELSGQAYVQLQEYFRGKRKVFTVPVCLAGTDFQKKVWRELQKIPYGETRTYQQIAEAVGNEKACRAVGMANNRNPIVIMIPCHRVIGANGSLTGYAGGLEKKEALLRLEGCNIKGMVK